MARTLVLEPELRSLSLDAAHAELREDDTGKRFFGHAAVFDTRTAIGNPLRWGFYEEVAPGAFTKTISEGDARMLIDHDSYYVVSRVSAGTLLLAQDAVGLVVDSALDDELSYVKDLKANLRNKNITGMSFGFYVTKDDWTTETVETSDGNTAEVEIRRILEVRLIEVSAVTFPAYPTTDAGLREVKRTLLGRGNRDAIRRRADMHEDFASLLRELPPRPTGPLDPRDKADELPEEADAGVQPTQGVDTPRDDVQSREEEPGESTPPAAADEAASEPGETTRIAPSERELAAARLRALQAQLRQAV